MSAVQEVDPNGLSAHTPGAKLDHGKPRPHLVLGAFPRALSLVTAVGTGGAIKYTDNGWLEVENGIARYEDARLRHYLKRQMGEMFDPDTGLPHEAHEAWNTLAALELKLKAADDREANKVWGNRPGTESFLHGQLDLA